MASVASRTRLVHVERSVGNLRRVNDKKARKAGNGSRGSLGVSRASERPSPGERGRLERPRFGLPRSGDRTFFSAATYRDRSVSSSRRSLGRSTANTTEVDQRSPAEPVPGRRADISMTAVKGRESVMLVT